MSKLPEQRRLWCSSDTNRDTVRLLEDIANHCDSSFPQDIEQSRNDIVTSSTSDLANSTRDAPRTAGAQFKWKDVGENNDGPKKQDWLKWNFDASVPPQVKLSGWALKMLDVVNCVAESDASQLQASLERYNNAVSTARASINDAPRNRPEQYTMEDFAEVWHRLEQDLIKDFTEVWNRSDKRFKASLQEQVDTALSTHDLDLRKEVLEILQQVDTSALSDKASSQDGEVPQIPEDSAETLPESPAGRGKSVAEHSDQQDQQVDAVAVPEIIDRQVLTPDDVVTSITIDPATLREDEALPEPQDSPSSIPAHANRFVSEENERWLRRTKREKEIAKARLVAQHKLREFQLRKSRHSDGMSASELQDAQTEYELARDRHRLLASSLEKEDSVIVRHKPTKAAPVVIKARRALPPALKLGMAKLSEKALQEEVAETAVATVAAPQADRTPEGEAVKQSLIEQTMMGRGPPLLLEKPLTGNTPVMIPRKGLLSRISNLFKSLRDALPESWKALSASPPKRPSATASTVEMASDTGTTKSTLDRAKAAGENIMELMRFRRDHVAAKARPGVESTDWQALGFANYGEWLTNRLHRPITSREAAYIDDLISASRVSEYRGKASRDKWRRLIQLLDTDNSAYAEEVADKRIHCHLEPILLRRHTEADSLAVMVERQRSEADKIYKRLRKLRDVMEVHTDASYLVEGRDASGSGGGIAIKTMPPIRESCQMGSMMLNSIEAEIGALYRGLQIVRDTLEKGSKSKNDLPYRRVLFATDSMNCLEAMTGDKMWPPEFKTTRMAALCRIEAYQILRANKDLEGIDFIWLPRSSAKGNVIADMLAKLGRLSRFNFVDDDRGRL